MPAENNTAVIDLLKARRETFQDIWMKLGLLRDAWKEAKDALKSTDLCCETCGLSDPILGYIQEDWGASNMGQSLRAQGEVAKRHISLLDKAIQAFESGEPLTEAQVQQTLYGDSTVPMFDDDEL